MSLLRYISWFALNLCRRSDKSHGVKNGKLRKRKTYETSWALFKTGRKWISIKAQIEFRRIFGSQHPKTTPWRMCVCVFGQIKALISSSLISAESRRRRRRRVRSEQARVSIINQSPIKMAMAVFRREGRRLLPSIAARPIAATTPSPLSSDRWDLFLPHPYPYPRVLAPNIWMLRFWIPIRLDWFTLRVTISPFERFCFFFIEFYIFYEI